jgi:hypothetical protein
MTMVTGEPMLTESGYCVPVTSADPNEGRAALAELAARQELADAHRDAERRVIDGQGYGLGVDRDEFRSRYGV